MGNSHDKRMAKISSVAIPPKGTPQRFVVEEFLRDIETPESRKQIRKLFAKARAMVIGQTLNGAGQEPDQALRDFLSEYNGRIWEHGLWSLPSTFNIVEAFLHYDPKYNTLLLHEEDDNFFSLLDFVDWYTSSDVEIDQSLALESFTPGIVYNYSNLSDSAELLYKIENGSQIGISGFAMVRFDNEISILCVAGEETDLGEETKNIIKGMDSSKPSPYREDIVPDPSLSPEAVPLNSGLPLWRFIALVRFDLKEMTQSVRYVCHDCGNSYAIKTDDPEVFLDMNGGFLSEEYEEIAKRVAEEIRSYNSLFDLCSTFAFLPLYFDKFAESLVSERFKTEYAEEINKASLLKIKKDIPPKYKKLYRTVNVLRTRQGSNDARATIYSVPHFHIETSGYYRRLKPGKMGCDKNGNPIHGKTWVSKKLSWMEADESEVLVANRSDSNLPPEGKDPGHIYVMRAPVHSQNIFKVGLTRRSTEERAKEIGSATGLPGKIFVLNEWPVGDCVAIESEVHNRLEQYRVDPRREFFQAPLKKIIKVIDDVIRTFGLKTPNL